MINKPMPDCVNAHIYYNDIVLCTLVDKPCYNYDTDPCKDYQAEGTADAEKQMKNDKPPQEVF